MKQRIVDILAVVAYYLRVDEIFYRLNRRAKRILTFHNVLEDGIFRAGIANGVSNKRSDFERIVDECAKRFKFSTDLFDAGTMTITFDDGYRNQYATAFKELKARGIPAYLFAAGDVLEGRMLTVDKLLHWTEQVPAGSYMLEITGGQKCEINESNRHKVWSQIIWPAFSADAEHKGLAVLEACDKAYPLDKVLEGLPEEYRRERLDGIEAGELEEMRKAGWKIGWHTKTHFPLSALSDEDIRKELDSPPEYRNCVLSYPYGEVQSVDGRAIRIAEEMGYPCAVSNLPTANHLTGKYFLPRMALPADKYRLHFSLSGMEYFIKTRKLLPVV